ncbi:MAG TPA: hypothetical protein VGM36_12930 [Rhizomicrobium sp.]
MIVRALFWIAVVAVLMPREPDLGLGRPGVSASAPEAILSKLTSLIEPAQAAQAATPCQGNPITCLAANNISVRVPDFAASGLASVRAQIEEARREREAHRHG